MKMSVFTQKLNCLSGKTVWELHEENYDYEQEIARSSFADMLHDTERNQMYFDALKIAIDKMHILGKKAKVLDIGTGTGLLSMMAVHCGADSVIACEAFTPMSDCAKKVVNLNGFSDAIKIVSKHSTDLTVGHDGDLPEKANILVTEVFDTELIGEGALGTFNHAHEYLLEKECIVIPDSAVIYAQVVETTFAQNWNTIKNIYNSEGELLIEAPTSIKECNGAAAVHDIQLSQFSHTLFEEIISPEPVLFFDWSGKTSLELNRCKTAKVKCKRNGKAQVVFMWWDLYMDVEKTIILSCAPYWAHPLNKKSNEIPWRDHWMQAVYYLPNEVTVEENEELNLISCHDEFSLWFYLNDDETSTNAYAKPVCKCGLHITHSRTRIGQLNDSKRNKKYLSMIDKCVNSESVVLLMGDGFYHGLAAAKLGAQKVLYLNDSNLATIMLNEFITINNLNNVEVVKDVEILKKHSLIRQVNLILGEPHFSTTILPWDSLHFAYLVNELKSCVSENCIIAPISFSIKGIVVEFKDLQKIRQPLEYCFDFNMKPFDKLIMEACSKCDAVVEAQPLWEYPCIARSPVLEIINLNLVSMFDEYLITVDKEFELDNHSKCNGIVFWVEWDLDGSEKNVISTGPTVPPTIGSQIQWDMHTRQGVHFLQLNKIKQRCQFSINIEEGSYKFEFL